MLIEHSILCSNSKRKNWRWYLSYNTIQRIAKWNTQYKRWNKIFHYKYSKTEDVNLYFCMKNKELILINLMLISTMLSLQTWPTEAKVRSLVLYLSSIVIFALISGLISLLILPWFFGSFRRWTTRITIAILWFWEEGIPFMSSHFTLSFIQ